MTSPRTLNELYFDALDQWHERPAVRFKAAGQWQPISWREFGHRVEGLAAGLADIGLVAGDRVAILSENRPEWAIADFACLTNRLVDVPIYPTLPAHQLADLLHDSGARALFVSTAGQLAKLAEIRASVPALEIVVAFDSVEPTTGVETFAGLLERGRAAGRDGAAWRKAALATGPGELATIIYTSGTTGEPKGVMLTHGNIASNVAAAMSVLPVSTADECLSLLPLSHIFERMTGHFSMISAGVIINYASSIESVPTDLREVRPTVVAAVPRLYEKMFAKALDTATHGSALTRRIFFWAKDVGERWADRTLAKAPIPPGLALQHRLADAIVFSRFRHRLGGRLRFFLSGGAPLSIEIARFFYAAGMPILEGYGLTETSPVITVNTLDAQRLGSVGRAIPQVEVKIAPDGEILARGPGVMAGYFGKPADTALVIDPDGWFHTGDIGEIDSDGYLTITDRKKDVIATAGGKKIAPQPIENLLRRNPFIANAVMLGDRRKFPIALLVPNFDRLEPWARSAGIPFASREELIARPEVQAHLEAEAKKHFRDLARFEVPKKFLLLPRDFSIDRGELTPKLSIKRKVVEAHNQDAIDAIYRAAEA